MNSATSNPIDAGASRIGAFPETQGPVVCLSSRAGLGNYSAGEAIAKMLPGTRHLAVDDCLGEDTRRRDFERYRLICDRAPWLLHLIYRFPVSYALKYARERLLGDGDYGRLASAVGGAATVIATNHRSAFWIGSLKRQKRIRCRLWAVMTDYRVSPGWKFVFWDEIDRFFGPLPADEIPPSLRSRYTRIPFPVHADFSRLCGSGNPRRTLVTGGGWGLGPLESTVASILRRLEGVGVDVVCGENTALERRLKHIYTNHPDVRVHGKLDSLLPLMEACGSVITRAGAATLSEAAAARRKIFILPSLPVVEAGNRLWAIRHFGAEDYSEHAFRRWLGEGA